MRKPGVLLLLLFILCLLPGCGAKAPKEDGPLTINRDGTLGNLRWGMRHADAAYADSRIVFDALVGPNWDSCEVEFLGRRWRLKLFYSNLGWVSAAPDRLWRLSLEPLEEGGSWEELVEPLEAVLGPRNVRSRVRDGTMDEREALPEWAWCWSSPERLGDLVSRETLEGFLPNPAQVDDTLAFPLFTVFFVYGDYSIAWYGTSALPEGAAGLPRIEIAADAACRAAVLSEAEAAGQS